MTTAPTYDPLNPTQAQDPYPVLDALRAHDPVWWWNPMQSWVVTGYDEVNELLRSSSFSASPKYSSLGVEAAPAGGRPSRYVFGEGGLFFAVGPDHARLRRLIIRALSPAAVEKMRTYTATLVDEVLAGWEAGQTVDIASGLADAIPVQVITRLVGFIGRDAELFHAIATRLIKFANPLLDEAGLAEVDAAADDFVALIDREAEARRGEPRDDLLTRLLEVHEGEGLSRSELLAMVSTLLVGGVETTASALKIAIANLVGMPDQVALLRERGAEASIDELLRYDYIGNGVPRFAMEDTELGGHTIKKGQLCWAAIISAGHDPAVYECPHQLRLDHVPPRPLVFGVGSHTCVGENLARMEMQVVLDKFFDRFPDAKLGGDPEWKVELMLRGPVKLPVTL